MTAFSKVTARTLRAPRLIVLIGEPRTGKTRFALNLAASMALTTRPRPVVLFAPGSDKRTLLCRLSATSTPAQIRAVPLFVVTTPRLWPIDMWLTARRIDRALRRRGARLSLIIADDLHRVGGRSYAQKVSDFRMLGREMSLPIVVLARPHLSLTSALKRERVASTTMRNTGYELEQDAHRTIK